MSETVGGRLLPKESEYEYESKKALTWFQRCCGGIRDDDVVLALKSLGKGNPGNQHGQKDNNRPQRY